MKPAKDERAQRSKTCAEVIARTDSDGLDLWECELIVRLIADVEDATRLLGEASTTITTGAGTYDLLERIATFLKEPSG